VLAAAERTEKSTEERVKRIEKGLLPAVVVKGQPLRGMSLTDRMKHYRVPGVSIAFFEHGRITWTRTYGFADKANRTAVNSQTVFQAASISKAASALAALRLVRDGKLALDENVNAKLHAWKVPDNEFTVTQPVTLRRILSHTAGLTVTGFPGYAAGEPLPTIIQILNGDKPANSGPVRVDAVPGTAWKYSGGGYTVMQLLLTEVTGRPYPEILDDLVLRPAGMTYSTFARPLPENLRSSAAIGYESNSKPLPGGFNTYPEMAAAGMWSTPSDLARMAMEVQAEFRGLSGKILSHELAREMLTIQKGNWGLGFALSDTDHQLRFGHGGGNEGFRCNLEAYLDSEQGIAIMTNSTSGDPFISEIERAVAREYAWPDFHPQEKAVVKVATAGLSAYSGHYRIMAGGVLAIEVNVTVKGGRLFLQAAPFGDQPVEMLPESEMQFFSTEGFSISFEKDPHGAVKMILHAGENYDAEKLS
jgi:CubicO group peptidase (beta-lactamase class C family)